MLPKLLTALSIIVEVVVSLKNIYDRCKDWKSSIRSKKVVKTTFKEEIEK